MTTNNQYQFQKSDDPKFYHGERKYRHGKDGVRTSAELRPFIAWDGEGINILGDGRPQRYCLFGCSIPSRYIVSPNLGTKEIFDLILDVEKDYPDAFHVGFGFGYDINQIVKGLSRRALQILHNTGIVYLWNRSYRIQWRKRKSFTITRYTDSERVSATIYDCWSFFMSSFVVACKKYLGDSPELQKVSEGKDLRSEFKYEDMDYVRSYWETESTLLASLCSKFREIVYSAGLRITEWHGPGALASYANKKFNTQNHMATCPEGVNDASQYAYAGGRFELFKIGHFKGTLWSYDINSAYPEAISKLPSLREGMWRHTVFPTRIAYFGVYRLQLIRQGSQIFSSEPGPLFFRDRHHLISYPWKLEGWYWSPEASIAIKMRYARVIEGYEWMTETDTKPFGWVPEMYAQRRKLKDENNAAEYALKLCMNSLYGKMAQRVGYNASTNTPPSFHQLEWAGWVTSYTRAKLYAVMHRIGYDKLISVETDGIFTTADPASLQISDSKNLGGWEVKQYDEIIYLQSGFYWVRAGNTWKSKYRGFDPGSITLDDAINYCRNTDTHVPRMSSIVGTTSRFIGLGAALARGEKFREYFCVWEQNEPREVTPGADGKRRHYSSICRACADGQTLWDSLHDLHVTIPVEGTSTAHSLPWKNRDLAPWREIQEIEDAYERAY